MGTEEVRALDGIDLDVPEGDYLAIMGPSGSGKSTLLNLLGCLDRSSEGSHEVNGIEVTKLSDNELSKVRGESIGFVFQSYNSTLKFAHFQCRNTPVRDYVTRLPNSNFKNLNFIILKIFN